MSEGGSHATTAGASSSACAPTGIDPFPARLRGVVPIARRARGARGARARRGDRRPRTASPAAWRPAAATAGAAFLDLVDRSGRIQLHARKDVLGEESFDRLASLDLGDLIGVDGAAFKSQRAASCRCASTGWTLLAKSLRAAAGEVPRARGRRDPLPPPRARPDRQRGGARAVHPARAVVAAVRRWLDERGLPRGRDAGAAAALRRRARAPVHRPTHNALDRDALPAHRHRALPQAPDRRRPRARLRDRQGLPQRGPLATSTTPSSRCSSGTRPTRTTTTSPTSSSSSSRTSRPAGRLSTARSTSRRRGGA